MVNIVGNSLQTVAIFDHLVTSRSYMQVGLDFHRLLLAACVVIGAFYRLFCFVAYFTTQSSDYRSTAGLLTSIMEKKKRL